MIFGLGVLDEVEEADEVADPALIRDVTSEMIDSTGAPVARAGEILARREPNGSSVAVAASSLAVTIAVLSA